jgi:hypothetical protein
MAVMALVLYNDISKVLPGEASARSKPSPAPAQNRGLGVQTIRRSTILLTIGILLSTNRDAWGCSCAAPPPACDVIPRTDAPEIRAKEYSGCMASSYPEGRIERDRSEARFYGVQGAPTVFVNGRKHAGFADDAAFMKAMKLALQSNTQIAEAWK